MSTHAFTVLDLDAAQRIIRAVDVALPREAHLYDATTLTFTFTPDLTAAEQTTLTELVRAGQSILTRSERNAIEPFLATGRLFVGQSQAQFMALTEAQQDRMVFDNITALWRVIFRQLRDG